MTDQTALPPVPGFVDLHARLAAGETLYGAFAGLGSPVATELMARAGFDWLIIDLEHGAGTESDLLANLHAIGATPTAALVRPQSGERLRIGRALDLGAHGIMVPRVDLPEQAREAVSFMRYPPDGTRGLALSTRGAGLGELGHTRTSRRSIAGSWASSRSSRASAVEHAAEIAAIDGVDVLFVGPTDLSHSLGVPGQFDDPVYLDALRHVAATAEAAGKAAGILLRDASSLARHRDLGFRFIGLGSDGAFITDGGRAVLAATRAEAGRRGRRPAAALSPRPPPRAASPARVRPRGRGEVWAMITPSRIEPGPEQLDRREALVEDHERQHDDEDRLGRADQRRLRRPDPASPGVQRLDRQERGEEADPDQVRPGGGRDGPRIERRARDRGHRREDGRRRGHHHGRRAGRVPGGRSRPAGASLPSRSRRSPDRRADRTIQTE